MSSKNSKNIDIDIADILELETSLNIDIDKGNINPALKYGKRSMCGIPGNVR